VLSDLKFNILHTESSQGWGGQENRIYNEALGIKKLGSRVIIVSQPGSILGQRAATAGIETRYCRMRKSYDLPAVLLLIDLIKKEKIDVINTHSGKDSLLAAIAGRLSSKKPIIVRTRHLALPITSKFTYSVLPHKIVTVSERVRQYWINEEGISPEKIEAIPTGVNLERFNPAITKDGLRSELGLRDSTPLVGMIAIFRRKKGHNILLEAVPDILKAVPEVMFVLAGNGPNQEEIKTMASNMGIDKHKVFLVLRTEIPDVLKSIDIFVLPTLQEALGTSILEAMAMEKPVVTSNIDGVPEIVKDGVNGILVTPGDPVSLAQAVISLLRDREKARVMGLEGRKLTESGYTVDRMVEGMHRLYLTLLNQKNTLNK
jgi:glycosyltransferase involved in cell wall biosynthesis